MKKTLLTAGCMVVLTVFANAQVQYSVNNFLRYGNGKQSSGPFESLKEYLENQTNVRLFWSDFTVGMQYLHDNPPESNLVPKYVGIKKRYVEFQNEGIELRAGDFFTLYGRGLAVNLVEDRGINYDTGLDGIRGIYRSDWFTGIAAFGSMRYYDLENPERIENYDVKSAHAELKLLDNLRVGGSAVGVRGVVPTELGPAPVQSDIFEGMITARALGFDLFAEFAQKYSSGSSQRAAASRLMPFSNKGWGLYASLGYSGDDFGATLEFKDYWFDPVNPQERKPGRPTRMLPVQLPPSVIKEHSFYLLTRNMHPPDFNDEIGMQLDVFYSLTPRITLNLNGSIASRVVAWRALSDGGFALIRRDIEFLPRLEDAYSPFYEAYAEVEWYLDDHSYIRAAFNRRYDAPYDEIYREAGNIQSVHEQSSWTLPVRIEYMLGDAYSIGASFEQQLFHDSQYKEPDYFNEFVSLTLAKAPAWAATVRMQFTTTDFDPSEKKFWITGEFTHRIGNAHTATVSYGTERGGLVCSNGICRLVEPFDGLRFSLLTQL